MIFRGFVWESAQLQAWGVGHWMDILQKFFQIRNQCIKNYLSICGDIWFSQIPILVLFNGLYGNWPFSRLKLWDVRWRHLDEVIFFFSFDPWAIFLLVGIFEFCPPKIFRLFFRIYMKVPVEKGRKWLFLTDLCFSWVKMDPAYPSYYDWVSFSPGPLFRRRMLGVAARKIAKPAFFEIST